MVWARLDDEILDNPKIAKAGVLGFALHVAAITWCCRNLTDGFVPRSKARLLLDMSGIGAELCHASDAVPAVKDGFIGAFVELGSPDADEIAEELIGVGLWIRDEERDGYWLKDFLEYNPSKEKVLADRAEKSAARSESGKRGAASRWGKRADGKPDGKPDGKSHGEAMAKPMANGWQTDGPVPVPDPDPDLPTEDPPLPPVVGDPPKVLGLDGENGEAWQAWRRGVSRATGKPVSGLGPLDKPPLVELANAHAGGLRGEALMAWITETAATFVASNEARYGYTTKRCAAWLDAGRPARAAPARRGAEVTKQPYDPDAPWLQLPEVGT